MGKWVRIHERLPETSGFYVVYTLKGRVRSVKLVRWVKGLPLEEQTAGAWRQTTMWFDHPIPHPNG